MTRIFSLILVLGVLGSSPIRAGTLVVGNLGQPPDTQDSPLQVVPYLSQFNSPGLTAAQQFTTGQNQASIDRIFATLGNLDTGTSGLFTFTAELYSDNTSQGNSIPDSVLRTFTYNEASIPTVGNGFANVEFDTSAITLAPSTNYWFVLQGSNSGAQATDSSFGSVIWQYTLSTTTYGPGLLVLSNQTYNNQWSNDPNSANYTLSFPDEPFLMQVGDASVVPEPSGLLLASIGLTMVGVVSRGSRFRLARLQSWRQVPLPRQTLVVRP
jgi:hypothetical protein